MQGETAETICSAATALLGAEAVQSLASDESEEAVACNKLYPVLRKGALSKYPWRFAMKTEQLSRLVTTPAVHWQYHFMMPPDRLSGSSYRLYPSSDFGQNTTRDFEDIGDKILSNHDTLFMQYIYDAPESTWPEYFVDFVVHALAAKLAHPLTRDLQLREVFMTEAYGPVGRSGIRVGGKLQEARTKDAADRPSRAVQYNPLLEARFGGA